MRIFDIIFSLMGLILLLPLLLLIYLLCWLDNRSPLFMQKRVGRYEKSFILIKFRSMPINTKSAGTHLIKNIKLSKFASFLRFFKFDEIPQLYNVLIGDMSLVGPRPCLYNQQRLIIERKKRFVFNVRPGITGLAQVSGINMSRPVLLAKTDLKMIKQMNLFYYFYYIFKTVLLIIRKKS